MGMTYEKLFGNERCACGKRGLYILSNGKGAVTGFRCQECDDKVKKEG